MTEPDPGPCAFCQKRGRVIHQRAEGGSKRFAVACNQGHRTGWYVRRDKALSSWNTRVEPEKENV